MSKNRVVDKIFFFNLYSKIVHRMQGNCENIFTFLNINRDVNEQLSGDPESVMSTFGFRHQSLESATLFSVKTTLLRLEKKLVFARRGNAANFPPPISTRIISKLSLWKKLDIWSEMENKQAETYDCFWQIYANMECIIDFLLFPERVHQWRLVIILRLIICFLILGLIVFLVP